MNHGACALIPTFYSSGTLAVAGLTPPKGHCGRCSSSVSGARGALSSRMHVGVNTRDGFEFHLSWRNPARYLWPAAPAEFQPVMSRRVHVDGWHGVENSDGGRLRKAPLGVGADRQINAASPSYRVDVRKQPSSTHLPRPILRNTSSPPLSYRRSQRLIPWNESGGRGGFGTAISSR